MESLYTLSNQSMDIITRSKDFPSKNIFQLSTADSDLVTSLGKNDYLIGDYLGNIVGKESHQDCDNKVSLSANQVLEDYEKRKWRVGAIAINSMTAFETIQRKKYEETSFNNFIRTNNLDVSKYNWDSLLSRMDGFDKNADALTNSKRLAALLRHETGLDIPEGVLAAEFMYRDLLAKPQDWKSILSKSKDALNFDQKIALVAKLGGDFGGDYNYARTDAKNPDSKGVIPITALLEKLSTPEAGGVCRDVALAQAQMLHEMGVKDAYTVAYTSNRGGHATLLAVDPNDKDRIIKMNYGELYIDDGKKGMSAIDQDNTLPNVGFHYRVYDHEGKPLASVPTEIGSILREATDNVPDIDGSVNNYTLAKAYVGGEGIKGSLFTGKTSSGDTITGVAIISNFSTENVVAEAAVAGYKADVHKTYFSMDQKGVYANSKIGARATVYEGSYGKLGAGVGATVEVMSVNTKSISAANRGELQNKGTDVNLGSYAKANYDLNVDDKNSIGASVEVKGRYDKKNIADEGSYSMNYDSTVLIAKYDYKSSEKLKTSLAVAETLSRYGNSTAFKASLVSGTDTFSVSGNVRNGDRAPAFFPGQQNSLKAAYERATSNGWNFKVEYGKNFDSKTYQFTGTASKAF